MSVTLTIRDQSAPGGLESAWTIEDIPSRITLRDLIRTRVREEVARANAEPGREHRLLVQPLDAEVSANGYRLSEPRRLDWEEQARVAIEAFAHNGFFVIVGDHQITELDDELDLEVDTEVSFLRLMALVGG